MHKTLLILGISGFPDFVHHPMDKSRNPEIPCVIHHRHNPSETIIDLARQHEGSKENEL
jgi:hypothetical protein